MQSPEDVVAPGLSLMLRKAVALGLLAVLAVSFAISFAALVYSGPLVDHVSVGIGLAILGIVAMPLIAGMTSSYRGMQCHVQDFPSVLIAGAALTAATTLAAESHEVLPTIVALVGATTLVTGLGLYAGGRLRLGALARFVPYSVIGGFLAATGYLLVAGALSMMVKDSVSLLSWGPLFEEGALALYLPWLVFSIGTVAALRLVRWDMTLPVCIIAGFMGFYGVLLACGIDLEEAGAQGLLLGPFTSGNFLEGLSPSMALEVRWDVILREAPTILAILLMSFLGLLLNASGLELSLGRDLDFERELKSAGAANVAAGLSGGLVGYQQLGETILSTRLGVTDLSGALAIAGGALLTLLFGAQAVGAFPVGLAAAVIAILGFDLLYEWLVVQRRRLPAGDFLIVILILFTAATVGFLEALVVGLMAATLLFIVSYAGVDVVRFRTSGATRRSTVERSRPEMARLSTLGKKTEIFELGGFIFFGTAHRLFDTLRETFRSPAPPRHVVFNLARVTGGDTTARLAVVRVADLCRRNGADLVLAGVPADLGWLVEDLPEVRLFPTIDSALVALEDAILTEAGQPTHAPEEDEEDIVAWLERLHPGVDVSLFTEKVMLREGEMLIREGDTSTAIYQLCTGELRAEVAAVSGGRLVVARFRPGALVGEIAHYARVPRTAAVVAEAPSAVLRIDIDRIPDTPDGRALAADLHRRAAGHLALRLMRMTNMVREAGF